MTLLFLKPLYVEKIIHVFVMRLYFPKQFQINTPRRVLNSYGILYLHVLAKQEVIDLKFEHLHKR